MSQLNIKKTSNFSIPPSNSMAYSFNSFGDPVYIKEDGTIIKFSDIFSQNNISENLIVNDIFELSSSLPLPASESVIYITLDNNVINIGNSNGLYDQSYIQLNQFITNSSENPYLLYQFNGSQLMLVGSGSGDYLPLTGGELTGSLTATTYYGDGSKLTGIVAGVDISAYNAHTGDTSIHFTKDSINISDINSAHTHMISDVSDLQTILNSKLNLTGGELTGNLTAVTYYGDGSHLTGIVAGVDISLFNSHTGDTSIHFTKESINISDINSAHTHQITDIPNLQITLNNKTDLTTFNSHTATTNAHNVSFSNLISTAHTHILTDIPVFPSTLIPNKMLKVNSGGTAYEATVFTADQVLNTSDIDVSDPSWIEQEVRLVTVKKESGQPSLDGAAELMDLMLPPGVLATLEASDANWTNESKTVTGDNSTYALGRLGQIGWLSDRTFVQCMSATYAVSGSAVFNRNRAVDSLNINDSQDAIVINQLDRSYIYPAMTPTGESTDLGWDLLTQTKVLNNTTYPAKLGTWFVGGINGAGYNYYCYAIIGGNSYWKRNGQAEAVQRMITTSSHPNLTSALLAFDFSTGRYTQTGLEVSYQDQTFQDTTSGKYFIKVTDTQWDLFVNRDDLNTFYTHTGDTSIHFTKNSINFSDLGSTAHTHTISDVSNLQTSLDNKTNLTLFNAHTATTNAHQVSFNNLTSTAHTHTVSEISGITAPQFYNVNTWDELKATLSASTIPANVTINIGDWFEVGTGDLVTNATNITFVGRPIILNTNDLIIHRNAFTIGVIVFEGGIDCDLYGANNKLKLGNAGYVNNWTVYIKYVKSQTRYANLGLEISKIGSGNASVYYNDVTTNYTLIAGASTTITQSNIWYNYNNIHNNIFYVDNFTDLQKLLNNIPTTVENITIYLSDWDGSFNMTGTLNVHTKHINIINLNRNLYISNTLTINNTAGGSVEPSIYIDGSVILSADATITTNTYVKIRIKNIVVSSIASVIPTLTVTNGTYCYFYYNDVDGVLFANTSPIQVDIWDTTKERTITSKVVVGGTYSGPYEIAQIPVGWELDSVECYLSGGTGSTISYECENANSTYSSISTTANLITSTRYKLFSNTYQALSSFYVSSGYQSVNNFDYHIKNITASAKRIRVAMTNGLNTTIIYKTKIRRI